jgi:hypothetical protein
MQKFNTSKNITASISSYLKNQRIKKTTNRTKLDHSSYNESYSNGWPAKPEHQKGVTVCNTQCRNGDCLRTYDDGRHVHLHIPPSIDPFTNEMKFDAPPC